MLYSLYNLTGPRLNPQFFRYITSSNLLPRHTRTSGLYMKMYTAQKVNRDNHKDADNEKKMKKNNLKTYKLYLDT